MTVIEHDASQEAGAAMPSSPPRENLIRARHDQGALELIRGAHDEMPVLTGHAAVFNQWTEINSVHEGRFLERIAPGAFAKTINENRDRIKVLFQHGKDPQIGDKPLGPLRAIEEDGNGLRYEVPLLDTSYNRDLIPGLEAGLYGASFRFSVIQHDLKRSPKKSEYNPRGLPERTVQELRMPELGPVTFPAYASATAGLRSMTDEFMLARFQDDPERLAQLLGYGNARFDNEDISCLAQMLVLGSGFIAEQDEGTPGEASAAQEMRTIVVSLAGLITGEAAETEPAAGNDEEDGEYGLGADGDERAVWSTAFVDDLPNSAFLYIEDGGTKDSQGKTAPRSLRHFPYRDSSGKVDLPHLRNALARIPQSDLPQATKDSLTAKAQHLLAGASGRSTEPASPGTTTRQPGIEPEPSEATTHQTNERGLFWYASEPRARKVK